MINPAGQQELLAIYLNDHLAGAVAGTNLAKRLARAEREWAGEVLDRLAAEIEEDSTTLAEIMVSLRIPIRQYKRWAAWTMEKVTRLKPNGQLLARSPLSRVLELESMRLGVEGKAAGWRTLRARASTEPRLDSARLDELIARARRQIDELERLRVRAAVEAFGGTPEPVQEPEVSSPAEDRSTHRER